MPGTPKSQALNIWGSQALGGWLGFRVYRVYRVEGLGFIGFRAYRV